MLRQRYGKRKDGTISGRPERVTLAELKEALRADYRRVANNLWKRAEYAFAHIEKCFGAKVLAMFLTKARVADYQAKRLTAGAARNSVRYEIAILSAAFGVAVY